MEPSLLGEMTPVVVIAAALAPKEQVDDSNSPTPWKLNIVPEK